MLLPFKKRSLKVRIVAPIVSLCAEGYLLLSIAIEIYIFFRKYRGYLALCKLPAARLLFIPRDELGLRGWVLIITTADLAAL
jgi:hypothetical protein